MGGLRWHAVRVGRLLRSTEGVGAESNRVTGWRRVAGSRFEESRGQSIAQASRLAHAGVAQVRVARGGIGERQRALHTVNLPCCTVTYLLV